MGAKNFKETRLFKLAFEQAMDIWETSKQFPKEETYSLTDQMRRSSRSVCANIGEAYGRNVIRLTLFQKLPIVMLRIRRQIFGLIFRKLVDTLQVKNTRQ